MKKKIRLRDMTEEQYVDWLARNCPKIECCDDCLFSNCYCSTGERMWVNHKEIFSDKFLDREVEIEVPDVLTPEEKEYLKSVIKPFREKIKIIEKAYFNTPNEILDICYQLNDGMLFSLLIPVTPPLRFSGIGQYDSYTLEELGL